MTPIGSNASSLWLASGVLLIGLPIAGSCGGTSLKPQSDATGAGGDTQVAGSDSSGGTPRQSNGGTRGVDVSGVDGGGESGSGAASGSDTGAGASATSAAGEGSGGQTDTRLPLGDNCSAHSQCDSGHCYDGVCCNDACDTPCHACIEAYTGEEDGECDPVSENTDIANRCPAGACDANGVCRCQNGVKDGNEICVDCGGDCGVCEYIWKCGGCAGGLAFCGQPGLCGEFGACLDGEVCSSNQTLMTGQFAVADDPQCGGVGTEGCYQHWCTCSCP